MAGLNVGVCGELVQAMGVGTVFRGARAGKPKLRMGGVGDGFGRGVFGLERPGCGGGFAAVLFGQTGLEIPKEQLSEAILLVTIVMPDE